MQAANAVSTANAKANSVTTKKRHLTVLDKNLCVLARRSRWQDEFDELCAGAAAEAYIPTDLHNSRINRKVVCYSHSHQACPHIWRLSYIKTEENRRSQGIGEAHVKRLIEKIKASDPDALGLFFEIESRREAGISEETLALRQRRHRFYERLGAKTFDGIVLIPGTNLPGYSLFQMEVMWFPFSDKANDEHVMEFVEYLLSQVGNLCSDQSIYKMVMSQDFGDVVPTEVPGDREVAAEWKRSAFMDGDDPVEGVDDVDDLSYLDDPKGLED